MVAAVTPARGIVLRGCRADLRTRLPLIIRPTRRWLMLLSVRLLLLQLLLLVMLRLVLLLQLLLLVMLQLLLLKLKLMFARHVVQEFKHVGPLSLYPGKTIAIKFSILLSRVTMGGFLFRPKPFPIVFPFRFFRQTPFRLFSRTVPSIGSRSDDTKRSKNG